LALKERGEKRSSESLIKEMMQNKISEGKLRMGAMAQEI